MVDFEEIEEIRSKDFYSVIDIIYESKLIDESLLNTEKAISFIKYKLDRNKAKIFAKKDGDTLIAFMLLYYKVDALSMTRYNWHISYLYVKPAFRREKIGKQIMLKCIDYARKTRVEHLSLNTDTENYAAHKLYEDLGFIRKNFIANYYSYEFKLTNL
jgi:ribosomal protein S18 acetylase RimI-like enzyme